MHREHFGKPSRVLVIQAGGLTLNPTLSADAIGRARAEDPLAARSEWDAQFREDISQFLTDDIINPALRPGRKALALASGNRTSPSAIPPVAVTMR